MQNQNQFAQTPEQGQMDLRFNPAVISAVVDSTQATPMVAGQAVKQLTTSTGIPKIVGATADTDQIFGFLNRDLKDENYPAGARVEVAAFRDNVMYMTASAAISAGAAVMVVIASQKVATATAGKTVVGIALDAATADGQLIRVQIDLPGYLHA